MTLKQGDSKQEFSTGAQRDTTDGKSRPDLISPVFLDRLGQLMAEGAKHYGERNWEKGMPLSRLQASAMRHMVAVLAGQVDEDHAIQCAFNLMAFVHTQQKIKDGELPAELDDLSLRTPPIGRGWRVIKTFTVDEGTAMICPNCHAQLVKGTVGGRPVVACVRCCQEVRDA